MFGKTYSWSVIKRIHSNWQKKANILLLNRTLFSKTGKWESSFTEEQRKEIENFWKPRIQELDQTQRNAKSTEKYYVLSMFPYPSGRLHMGHVRVYTISDTMARYKRLQGKKVIHPMGWDAFGLPAENAAIERGEHPVKWTYSNIKSMKKQIEDLCCSFDWERELSSCDSSYYKWTQYIFLKMYEAGLVYQKEALVNWDPVDKTVLADEQIDEFGCSWRSGAKIEKRSLRQWYLRTTAYAKSLWDGLSNVNTDLWRDIIKLQKNWIGKCNGCHFEFNIMNNYVKMSDPLSVFTKEPAAIFGVSHLAVTPSHPLNCPEYQEKSITVTESGQSKDYLQLSLKAIHPFTKVELPIIVSPATEFDIFNDCRLGIPCLFPKDASLAAKFNLSYVNVFSTENEETTLINSNEFNGLKKVDAFDKITKYARDHHFGGHLVSIKLKDWLISRQRYWGTPIPLVHCANCKIVPVPFEDLPVKLPTVETFSEKSNTLLTHLQDWHSVKCPKCGGPAHRETDTMDTFVDSSWYFLRYLDPHNNKHIFDPDIVSQEMPVDLYIGGKEHATLHLYYARFVNHFLHDLGFIAHREPFVNLLTQGMVMGKSYKLKGSGRYLPESQVDLSGEQPTEIKTGALVEVQWEKMSKSKYNGVDPEDVLQQYGIDATRLCILYNVAPKSNRNWSIEEFRGVLAWQSRIWRLVTEFIQLKTSNDVLQEEVTPEKLEEYNQSIRESRNYFLKEVTFHLEKTFLLSVAISRLQGLTNDMKKIPPDIRVQIPQFERTLSDLIIMLASFVPCFASELWAGVAHVASPSPSYNWDQNVLLQKWPQLDEDIQLPLIVKCNGAEIFNTLLPRNIINQLTTSSALQHSLSNKRVAGMSQYLELQDLEFILYKDYRATLSFPKKAIQKSNKQKKVPSVNVI